MPPQALQWRSTTARKDSHHTKPDDGDMFELRDGPAQIERDLVLCNSLPTLGFPFAWADPELQSFLWQYDTKAVAGKLLENHISRDTRTE